jgi:preprotein translocase subunit SecB
MTDSLYSAPPESANGPEAPIPPTIRVLAQYVRDLSFENPKAPESLRGGAAAPHIDLSVEIGAQGRDGGLFEIELKMTAAAKRESEPVFHMELAYAGLFQISGVAAEELEPVLMIECPRYLFPFARRLFADLSAEGGFTPLMLDPIDFAAIYMARRAQAQAAAGNA